MPPASGGEEQARKALEGQEGEDQHGEEMPEEWQPEIVAGQEVAAHHIQADQHERRRDETSEGAEHPHDGTAATGRGRGRRFNAGLKSGGDVDHQPIPVCLPRDCTPAIDRQPARIEQTLQRMRLVPQEVGGSGRPAAGDERLA